MSIADDEAQMQPLDGAEVALLAAIVLLGLAAYGSLICWAVLGWLRYA